MRKPRPLHDHGSPGIAAYRLVGAMSGTGQSPAPASLRAISLMQQIYELDAALAKRQLTASNPQDLYDEWRAHEAVIRRSKRRGSRTWAIELLRIVAVRHGIDTTALGLSPVPFAEGIEADLSEASPSTDGR